MAEPVQGRPVHPSPVTDADEAVGEHAGRPAVPMKPIGGEQPRPRCLGGFTVAPFFFQPGPQCAVAAPNVTLRPRPDLGLVSSWADTDRSMRNTRPLRSPKPQRCRLTPARSGVGGQADNQEILFCQSSKLASPGSPVISGDGGQHGRLSCPQQLADIVIAQRAPWFDSPGSSHAPDRVHVDDPLVVGPSDGRPQDAEPAADHAEGHPVGRPAGEGGAQLDGGERHDPGVGQAPVLDESPGRRAVPDHRRRLPGVVARQPPPQELLNAQEGRRPARGPSPAVLVSQVAPVGLGVDRLAPEHDGPLQRATGHRVGADRHSDLAHARSPLAQRPCPSRSSHPPKVGTEVGTYRRALQRRTARFCL